MVGYRMVGYAIVGEVVRHLRGGVRHDEGPGEGAQVQPVQVVQPSLHVAPSWPGVSPHHGGANTKFLEQSLADLS